MEEARLRRWGRLSLVTAVVLALGSSVLYQALYLTTRANDGVMELEAAEAEPVSFSFDGEDAGKIKIVDLDLQGREWEYSLDGGESWSSGEGREQWISENEHELTAEEMELITAENDIIVHFAAVAPEEPGTEEPEEPGTEEPGDDEPSGDENPEDEDSGDETGADHDPTEEIPEDEVSGEIAADETEEAGIAVLEGDSEVDEGE